MKINHYTRPSPDLTTVRAIVVITEMGSMFDIVEMRSGSGWTFVGWDHTAHAIVTWMHRYRACVWRECSLMLGTNQNLRYVSISQGPKYHENMQSVADGTFDEMWKLFEAHVRMM